MSLLARFDQRARDPSFVCITRKLLLTSFILSFYSLVRFETLRGALPALAHVVDDELAGCRHAPGVFGPPLRLRAAPLPPRPVASRRHRDGRGDSAAPLAFAQPEQPLCRGRYNRSIAIGILPVSTFCSGHTYFIQRMPQRRGLQPFAVHTTFQYSGAVGKTHRLREAMLWSDPPSYFDPPQGLIRYTPKVRRELNRECSTRKPAVRATRLRGRCAGAPRAHPAGQGDGHRVALHARAPPARAGARAARAAGRAAGRPPGSRRRIGRRRGGRCCASEHRRAQRADRRCAGARPGTRRRGNTGSRRWTSRRLQHTQTHSPENRVPRLVSEPGTVHHGGRHHVCSDQDPAQRPHWFLQRA